MGTDEIDGNQHFVGVNKQYLLKKIATLLLLIFLIFLIMFYIVGFSKRISTGVGFCAIVFYLYYLLRYAQLYFKQNVFEFGRDAVNVNLLGQTKCIKYLEIKDVESFIEDGVTYLRIRLKQITNEPIKDIKVLESMHEQFTITILRVFKEHLTKV